MAIHGGRCVRRAGRRCSVYVSGNSASWLRYEDLARAILTKGGGDDPKLEVMVQAIAAKFHLTEEQCVGAIDRTLGGMFRAMTERADARPHADVDPVVAAAFDICVRESRLLDAIYPGWREWTSSLESTAE